MWGDDLNILDALTLKKIAKIKTRERYYKNIRFILDGKYLLAYSDYGLRGDLKPRTTV